MKIRFKENKGYFIFVGLLFFIGLIACFVEIFSPETFQEGSFSLFERFKTASPDGTPSGVIERSDGSAYWSKPGIGKLEWDKARIDSCSGTNYLNVTSWLSSQNLDIYLKTGRPIGIKKRVWIKKNISHSINDPYFEWVNITSVCDDFGNGTEGCIEEQDYQRFDVYSEEWFFDWFEITHLLDHKSVGGNEYYGSQFFAEQDRLYEFKFEYSFPFEDLGHKWGCDEKFGLFGKRSSETISEVLANGNYVELDPFALEDFTNRQVVTFTAVNYTPNGSIVLMSVDTTGFTTQADWKDVRIYDNDNSQSLNFINMSVGTNDTVFAFELLATGTGWTEGTSHDIHLYFNDDDGTTASSPPYKLDWMFVPSDGDGNRYYVYDYRNHTRYEMIIDNPANFKLNDFGFGANHSINISGLVADTGLNCTLAMREGVFEMSSADAISIQTAFQGIQAEQALHLFYPQVDAGAAAIKLELTLAANGEANFRTQSGSVGTDTVNTDETIWHDATHTISTSNAVWVLTKGSNAWLNNEGDNKKIYSEPLDVEVNMSGAEAGDVEAEATGCAIGHNLGGNSLQGDIRFMGGWSMNKTNTTYGVAPIYTFATIETANEAPTVVVGNNQTVLEDSNNNTLDINMTLTPYIDADDGDGDALTFTVNSQSSIIGNFYINDNDVLMYDAGNNTANGTGEDTAIIRISDGSNTVDFDVNVTVETVNDNPWWNLIGNATASSLEINGTGYQELNVNASAYWFDVEQNQTPYNITISTNESGVDCLMDTPNNFSVVCNPDNIVKEGRVIVTVNGSDAGGLSALESFEFYAKNNTVWFDTVGNLTVTVINSTSGSQSIGLNASNNFRSLFYDRTPGNITISTNESGVDCYMNTVSNFSVFCNPSNFKGLVIVTVNGSDGNVPSYNSLESFEINVSNIKPTSPSVLIPELGHLNDTSPLNLSCYGSTDPEEGIVYYDFYNVTSDGSANNNICLNVGFECLWNATEAVNGWVWWKCFANDTIDNSTSSSVRSIRTETWDIIDTNLSNPSLAIESDNMDFDVNVSHNEIRYQGIEAKLNISGYNFTATKTVYDNH